MDMKKLIEAETNKHALKFYKKLYNEGYSLVSGYYKNNYTKVFIKCPFNHVYPVAPAKFTNSGQRCSECYYGKKRSERERRVKREIKESGYKLIDSKYNKDSKLEMLLQCSNGHVYEVGAESFLLGHRCRECRKQKHENIFCGLLEKEGYKLIGEYKDSLTYVKVRCPNDHLYNSIPNSFLHGARCPYCTNGNSRGERIIKEYLLRNNYEFIPQDRFDECKNKYPLPFDFGVYDDDKLICLIEFEGEQHYRPIEYFGGDKGFKDTKRNDDIKRKYCKDNNIPLIEIPYWEIDNIEEILDKKINELLQTT